ncbi:uncharacterized protein LOC133036252 [Cannabis sativa]|uniref:uncharacterized protein LOC133036252 n=1 Tax=Cannabis sativa TaxID=3483 RepID=UPI0029CAAA1B|nr:uncharacterized protein LOC133036252 [Cannabis sativa]
MVENVDYVFTGMRLVRDDTLDLKRFKGLVKPLNIFDLVCFASQSRQKSYVDPKRRDIEFQVRDSVFLRVSPMKEIRKFWKKEKLSPRFIDPFKILERVGQVAYQLALPPALSRVHNVFHISILRKYVSDPIHILCYNDIELQTNLSYEETPIQVLDQKKNVLRNKTIPLVKILWRNNKVEEATWELESQMRE